MATIAEKSRTKEIIDRLQGIINNASPVPLASGKVTIYKDEVQSLLTELASQMEIELKTYHEVNDRKGKIINEAKKEAEKIIYQAEHTASRMRVNKRVTNVAPIDYSMLTEEERNALGNANEIYGASLIYTDEMLTEVNNLISNAYENIRGEYEIIMQVLEEKMNTITANREELMTGLQEMDTEDRSQQILEIGQLLSNELYNARMKARMNSDEYEDGSVQLSLNLQEEQTKQAEEEAQRAVQALAEMTAERDALMATVEKMKHEGMGVTVRDTKVMSPAVTVPFVHRTEMAAAETAAATMAVAAEKTTAGMITAAESTATVQKSDGTKEKQQPVFVRMMDEEASEEKISDIPEETRQLENAEDEEYEIVYVTEDELEEGEEYEIEYVDEDELEDDEEYEIEYIYEDESVAEEYEKEILEHAKNPVEKVVSFERREDVMEESAEEKKDSLAETGNVEESVAEEPAEEKTDSLIEAVNENVEENVMEGITDERKEPVTEEEVEGKKNSLGEAGNRKEEDKTETSIERKDEEVKEAIRELEELEKESAGMPVIPHFKKSEKVASAPSEKVAKMATAITTEKKYSGLISRAVMQREKAESAVTVEETGEINPGGTEGFQSQEKQTEIKDSVSDKKDEDIKMDVNGNEYVQATMKFDEDFEIMEF